MVGVAWVITSSRSIPADAELRCDLCIVGAGDARFKVRAHLAIPGVGGLEIVRVLAHSGYGNRSGMSGGTYMCHIEAELGELRLSPANRACQFGFERTSYGIYCHRRFTFWAEKWHGQDVGEPEFRRCER